MRKITSTLKSAQFASSVQPYIHLWLTHYDELGTGNYTSYNMSSDTNRLLYLEHVEEPYGGSATIVLTNHEHYYPDDFVGYHTQIGYGAVTSAGNEYEETARLWVSRHTNVSSEGKNWIVLELTDTWTYLANTMLRLGEAPYYTEVLNTVTVYDFINIIFISVGLVLNELTSDNDDGIVNTMVPYISVNEPPYFDSAKDAIYRVLCATKCFLRMKPDLKAEIVYPTISGNAYDLEYFSDASPQFKEADIQFNPMAANHIYVFANSGGDPETGTVGDWADMVVGEAYDSDEQERYHYLIDSNGNKLIKPIYEHLIEPFITTQGDADNIANARLFKHQANKTGGRIVIQHDSRLELFDYIGIYDNRGT